MTGRRRRAGGDPLKPLLLNLVEGRSGSTLLMRSLDHPAIAFDRTYPYENRYLSYLAHLLWPLAEPFEADRWNMSDLVDGPADRFGPLPFEALSLDRRDLQVRLVRHAWAALSEALRAAGGRPHYYAEKAIGPTLPLLTAAAMPASVVNLVRDPRDVVCSIRAMDAKRGFYGFGRTESMSEHEYLLFVLGRMKANYASMASVDPMHRTIDVRYEDLVTDRAATLGRLGDFLGLSLAEVPSEDLHGIPATLHTTAADAGSSVGRWRADLDPGDVGLVEEALGPEMERHGYS